MPRSGAGPVDRHAPHQRLPFGRLLEAGDDAQQGGLAAARGADQADELALLQHEVGVAQRRDALALQLELLRHALDGSMTGVWPSDMVRGSSAAAGGRASSTSRSVMKPATPITTMPQITISVRDSWRASMMMAPSPVGTPVISPTTITTQAKPRPSRRPVKMRGQARRQHHLEELRRALAAEHAGRLEQARVDRAHAEDGVDQDRIERAEEHQEERRARPEPEHDHGERQPGGHRNRPQQLEGRVEQLAHQRDAPDHQAERQRDRERQREAAVDAAHRGDAGGCAAWRCRRRRRCRRTRGRRARARLRSAAAPG